jgi:phosphoglycerate dehydrogenase-like enzyme
LQGGNKKVPTTSSVILVTERIAPASLAWLRECAQVVEAAPGTPAFAQWAPAAQGLVVRTYTTVDGNLLERLPALRVVGRAGVGLDNIDQEACARRGIAVVNTPDANTQAVVEYVTSIVGAAIRPLEFLSRPLSLPEWEALRSRSIAPLQMSEMTLGILGLGRIGSRVAQVASAIGFRVIYNDIAAVVPPAGIAPKRVECADLFAHSDVISLHVDGRASNRRFVGERCLRSMKPTATLINTSRGMVIDEGALAQFLRAHTEARAYLDVHEPEPFTADSPLLGLPNAFLAPHLASRTRAAIDAMSWVVREVAARLGISA